MVVNIALHECVDWSHFICEHCSIDASGEDVSNHGILVKSPIQLVVEVGVVGSDLILHDKLHLFQYFVLADWVS